jgi:amidase
VGGGPLAGAPATWLASRLRAGAVSAREVLDAHLARIDERDPEVNAIVTLVAERAAAEARALDETWVSDGPVGPLHGLPIAIKDLVQTAGIRTTFGSPIYPENVPATDDLLVQRIRAAGAVVIGKTNTPEWGAGSHTFNPVFGVTRNPHDLRRSAGGSSGGAAAALAAGMVPIADGSDTGGSLRNPASFCGVVGFRPSPGRVPSSPGEPDDGLSVEGPMGRSVADAALLLSAIAGPDPRVPGSLPEPGPSFGGPLDADVAGTRVAFAPKADEIMPVDGRVVEVIERAATVLEHLGCRIEPAFPDLTGAREVFFTLRARMYADWLGSMLPTERDRIKPTVVWNIDQGLALGQEDVARAHQLRSTIHDRVDRYFERFDVLALPVSQVPPFPVDMEYPTRIEDIEMTTYLDWMESCWAITVTGLPAISVPCGWTEAGWPVGIQLVGRRGADLDLLRFAHAFEAAAAVPSSAPA